MKYSYMLILIINWLNPQQEAHKCILTFLCVPDLFFYDFTTYCGILFMFNASYILVSPNNTSTLTQSLHILPSQSLIMHVFNYLRQIKRVKSLVYK